MKFIFFGIIQTLILTIFIMQDCASQTMSYGSKKAFNYCNFYVKDAEQSQFITGFAFGFFGQFPISRNFYLQPEIYYTTKGARVTYDNTTIRGVAEFNVNYVESPLLLVFKISQYFNLHAGPYLSVMINSSVKNISDTNAYDFEKDALVRKYNNLEAGVAAGTGTEIGIFGFGVRYNYGFTGIVANENLLPGELLIPDAHNSVINLYLNLAVSKLREKKKEAVFDYQP